MYLQEVQLNPGEKSAVTVQYDSTYCADRHTRIEEHPLAVAYREHPHRVSLEPVVWDLVSYVAHLALLVDRFSQGLG